MRDTIHITDFLSQDEVNEFKAGHYKFAELFANEFLETDKPVHIDQFQTSGFWHKHHDNLQRKLGVYEADTCRISNRGRRFR